MHSGCALLVRGAMKHFKPGLARMQHDVMPPSAMRGTVVLPPAIEAGERGADVHPSGARTERARPPSPRRRSPTSPRSTPRYEELKMPKAFPDSSAEVMYPIEKRFVDFRRKSRLREVTKLRHAPVRSHHDFRKLSTEMNV